MYSAITVMGRNRIVAKYLDVPIWFYKGVGISRSHSSSSLRQHCKLYSQQAHQKDSSALTESKSLGGSEVSSATAFETGTPGIC